MRQTEPKADGFCKCGREAVYFRAQEGSHYCGNCLSRQIERQFEKTIAKGKMLEKDDTVAVGVSGGKDSMVLLHLMSRLSKKLPMKIIAITVDEGIEGYRDRSVDAVRKFTSALGIEHRIFSFEDKFGITIDGVVKKDPEIKPCTYCGVFRRTLLNKAAREVGADKLAVGHNLDDEAQSILMNVMRGDMRRMNLLSKSSDMFVRRIKPMKNVPEKEIVAYATVNNIPYFSGECPFSFNNARRDVQTMLNVMEHKYPGTKSSIISFYRKLEIGKKTVPTLCRKCGEPSSHEICKTCELLEKIKSTI